LAALGAQELQAAAEQAQQQQKEFLAVVAHELRNPLTPIRIAAEMLGQVGSEEMPRYQAIIENEIEHMVRLVSDLLDVSRVNTGKLRLERQVVDLTSIIDEAVAACRPAMDTRMQHFSVQVPPGPLAVNADPVRLAQILRNLLDNASKYTPKGGDIGLSIVVHGDAIVMTVSDSGSGSPSRPCPGLRAVCPGTACHWFQRSGPGHRAHGGARAGRSAWRHRGREQCRHRTGQSVRRHATFDCTEAAIQSASKACSSTRALSSQARDLAGRRRCSAAGTGGAPRKGGARAPDKKNGGAEPRRSITQQRVIAWSAWSDIDLVDAMEDAIARIDVGEVTIAPSMLTLCRSS
jgi:hypothetical protein